MNMLRLGLAAAFGLTFCASAGAATLLPMYSGTGSLQLLDPAAPVGAGNPVTVDSGLTRSELRGVEGIITATFNNPIASNIRVARLVYIKGGQIFVVNLQASASHAPVRISSISDACETHTRADFADVTNSWIEVERKGADGFCFSGDDVHTAIRINAAVTTPGVSPAGMSRFDPIYDGAGAIVGLLSVEGTTAPALKHRSATFGSPVTVLNLASTQVERFEVLLSGIYYRLQPQGESLTQLYRYDFAGNGTAIVGPLYHFGFIDQNSRGVDEGANDDANFYFADGHNLLRTPRTATLENQTSLVTALPNAPTIQRIHLSVGSTHVVMEAMNIFNQSGGIFSIPKDASNGTATTLKANNPTAEVFPVLISTAGNLVYFNVENYTQGTVIASRVKVDGTSPASAPSSYWAGAVIPTSFDLTTTSNPGDSPKLMIKVAKSGGSDSLRVVGAGTGVGGHTVGTIASTAPMEAVFAFGIGRYVPVVGVIQRDTTHSDEDVYVFDTTVADSLAPVLTTPNVDEEPIGDN